jgi:hypothetical protein
MVSENQVQPVEDWVKAFCDVHGWTFHAITNNGKQFHYSVPGYKTIAPLFKYLPERFWPAVEE